MTYEKIDLIFPYVVFAYGLLVTVTLNSAVTLRLAETRLSPELRAQLKGHRGLAVTCLWVGGLWILQNLWLA